MSTDMSNFKASNLLDKLLKTTASTLILSFSFGSLAHAQSSKLVTLKTETDLEISGELLSYSNDSYEIDSPFGKIIFPASGVTCVGQSCPENIDVTPPKLEPKTKRTVKDDSWVILNSIEGDNQVAGNLIGIENNEYLIDTLVGELRIDQATVTCQGISCSLVNESDSKLVVLVGENRRLEGILIESNQDFYVLEIADLDTFKIQRETYECIGAACP